MRVIGSHDISLTMTFWVGGGACSVAIVRVSLSWTGGFPDLPARPIARGQLRPRMTPGRLLVVFVLHVTVAEVLEEGPVRERGEVGGHHAVAVRAHERHVLVWEARHRAADADAAHVGAAADAVHPPAPGHVALGDRAFAAELDQA